MISVTWRRIRLPAVDADALKPVGVLTIYKIFLKPICCAFVVWIINYRKETAYNCKKF
jgi:hypothetical protein